MKHGKEDGQWSCELGMSPGILRTSIFNNTFNDSRTGNRLAFHFQIVSQIFLTHSTSWLPQIFNFTKLQGFALIYCWRILVSSFRLTFHVISNNPCCFGRTKRISVPFLARLHKVGREWGTVIDFETKAQSNCGNVVHNFYFTVNFVVAQGSKFVKISSLPCRLKNSL